jgi:methylphosphotriester-DNA--protein-cysteine methyltransferase
MGMMSSHQLFEAGVIIIFIVMMRKQRVKEVTTSMRSGKLSTTPVFMQKTWKRQPGF